MTLKSEFRIDARPIAAGANPYVIAEVGSNFNRSLDTARRLIDVAADAGSDAVKFQLFRADVLYPNGGDMYDLFKSIELDADWLPALKAHAGDRGLGFLASAFDKGSVDALAEIGVPAFKVASSETTNLPLLHYTAAKGRSMLISTGMCDMVDVEEAVAVCEAAGNTSAALLQCGAVYPLPPDQVNLRVMRTFADRFGCPVGFSDHTLGRDAAVASVALGAAVIEKHFTLDKNAPGPDHFYALVPEELNGYIAAIREAFAVLGSAEKAMLPKEREVGRREGLYAARNLAPGDVIGPEDVAVRRPALGLRARYKDLVVGARVARSVPKDAPLDWRDISF